MTATGYPTKYCVLEILSNILYLIEYSYDGLEGQRVTRLLYLQPTWEILQISKYQILSNTLYHMEYSFDYTGNSAGYPTFSVAYLVYSKRHVSTTWIVEYADLTDVDR